MSTAWPLDHPLHAVRLGKMERYLLDKAPSPEALYGYVIGDPDRSVREGLRRAAKKLEQVGLVERLPLGVYVRARDARREGLHFADGRFWRYVDPSRAHAVRRNVIWLSPFGAQIMLLYGDQLRSGATIRWDARTVLAAEARTRHKSIDRGYQWRLAIEASEDASRHEVLFASSRHRRSEVLPAAVITRPERECWRLAVSVARQRLDTSDAASLWELALRLYTTEEREALAAEAAGERRPTRAEQFRRQRVSQLRGY